MNGQFSLKGRSVPPKKTRRGRPRGEDVDHGENFSKKWLGSYCICGIQCSSTSSLSLHIRRFMKEGEMGDFKCEICHTQFLVYKMLQKHLELEHEILSSPKRIMRGSSSGCIDSGKRTPKGNFFMKNCKISHSKPEVVRKQKPLDPPSLQSDDSNDSIQFLGSFKDKQPDTSQLTNQTLPVLMPKAAPKASPSITPKIKGSVRASKQNGLVTTNGSAKQPQATSSAASPSTMKKARRTSMQVTRPRLRRNLKVTRTNKQPSVNSSGTVTTAKIMFGCAVCDNGFTRVYDLKRHLKNIHDMDPTHFPIACLHCIETFRTTRIFIRHSVTIHNLSIDPKQELPQASSSRDSVESVAIPILTIDEDDDEDDDDENIFESPPLSPEEVTPTITYVAAPAPSSSSEGMDEPLDTLVDHHQPDTTKMDKGFHCTCGTTYSYKKCFDMHIQQKTQAHQLDFPCNWCEKQFRTKPLLKAHTKKTHKMLVMESAENEGRVACVYCVSTFGTVCDLQRHQEQSHKVKGKNLGQVIRSRSKLRQVRRSGIGNPKIKGNSSHHEVVGTGLDKGKFKCACGRTYIQKRALRKHIGVQIRGKVFECFHCLKGFTEWFNLRVHTEAVHKADLRGFWGCGLCGEIFKSVNDRKRHRLDVHGTRR